MPLKPLNRTSGWRGAGMPRRLLTLSLVLLVGCQSGGRWQPARAASPGEAPRAGAQAKAKDRQLRQAASAPQLAPPRLKPDVPKMAPEHAGARTAAGEPQSRAPQPQAGAPEVAEDRYPLVGQLEKLTFGFAKPAQDINERLGQLEQVVYHQTYSGQSLFDRSRRLRETLVGTTVDPDFPPPAYTKLHAPGFGPQSLPPPPVEGANPAPGLDQTGGGFLPYSQAAPGFPPLPARGGFAPPDPYGGGAAPGQAGGAVDEDPLWQTSEYQKETAQVELEKFALSQVNESRSRLGLSPLTWDDLAHRVASELVSDLCRRNTLSHTDGNGRNPDERYTLAGGNDAMAESLVSLDMAGPVKRNKASVARMLRTMETRQDDRDVLLSPDATHFAFAFGHPKDRHHLIGCAEVVTKHGVMHPLPAEIRVGEKIDVKGVILKPYQFQKVTLAWEGKEPQAAMPGEESEIASEPMPYFPPLDYVAYANKAERDWEKAKMALRTVGVLAAIAGGMFIPPVALAAPLIAVAGTGGEIKPAADVPVKGGIKIDGSIFSGTLPMDNDGKSGLYYITVWATAGAENRPVAVSRRAVFAAEEKKGEKPAESGQADGTSGQVRRPGSAEAEK